MKIVTEISGKPNFPDDYLGPANPHPATLRMCEHILEIFKRFHPLGSRGVGYQIINSFEGYGDKSDALMDKVATQIKFMRLRGEIPFEYVIDESREIRTDTFWKNAIEIVSAAKRGFKLDLWPEQPLAVMVIAEKHGLAGILSAVTRPLRLPLSTLGGACSHTFAHDLATWIGDRPDQQVRILYLGDYDPSGVQIPVWLWREICRTARADGYELDHFYSDVTITRMAINSTAQARGYGAVLRQLSDEKLESNLRARDWDASEPVCEVDSIPPAAMQALVRQAIDELIDEPMWKRTSRREKREIGKLNRMMQNGNGR